MPAKFLSRKELGERIKRVRDAHGWSQEALAEMLGLSEKSGQGDVSAWERGKRSVPNKHLEELSRLTGEPLSYFVLDEPSGDLRKDAVIVAEWLEAKARELRSKQSDPPTKERVSRADRTQRIVRENGRDNEPGEGTHG